MKTLRLVTAFAALSAVGASYRAYGAHEAYGTYDRAPAPSAFSAFADPELTSLLDRALAQNQDLAAAAARRASDLSRVRYDAGAVSYLEVVEAERSALEAERARARLRGQRLVAAASLIRALGGGWENPAPAKAAPLFARN